MSDIPNWVTWASFYITAVGLAVSLFGLIATYIQARAAKNAAISAKESAEQAIKTLQTRNLFGTLSSTINHINMIREFINRNEITAARASYYHCARDVKDVFYNLNILSAPAGSWDNIDAMLEEISNGLDQQPLTLPKKASVIRSLRKISELMTTDEAKRKWQP